MGSTLPPCRETTSTVSSILSLRQNWINPSGFFSSNSTVVTALELKKKIKTAIPTIIRAIIIKIVTCPFEFSGKRVFNLFFSANSPCFP